MKKKIATIQAIEDVNNPDFEPVRSVNLEKLEKELAPTLEELRIAPTLDVITRTLEEANRVIKVADTSGNLKGGFVRVLKEAATIIRYAITNISHRSQNLPFSSTTEMETEKLRLTLSQMRHDKEEMQNRIAYLEQELKHRNQEKRSTTSPPLQLNSKSKGITTSPPFQFNFANKDEGSSGPAKTINCHVSGGR